MKWNEEDISRVEDTYIGMWPGVPGGPKLKAFVEAMQRFPPGIVVKAIENIAKSQDEDRRPAIKVIANRCQELTPAPRKPKPAEKNGESSNAFGEYIDNLPDDHPVRILLRGPKPREKDDGIQEEPSPLFEAPRRKRNEED